MKKKLAALTLGLALALSLVSCGGGSAEALISAMEEQTDRQTEVSTGNTSSETSPVSAETSGEDAPQDTSETESPASGAGAEAIEAKPMAPYIFSEGLAWVTIDTKSVGVVDHDGMVRFVVDVSDARAAGASKIGATPFADGASALYVEHSSNGADGFEIYDSAGNVLFDSEDGDDTIKLYLLGAGGGYYVIGKQVRSMTASETYMYVIDKDGNVLVPEKKLSDNVNVYKMIYVGDGIFVDAHASAYLIDINNTTIDDYKELIDNLSEEDIDIYIEAIKRQLVRGYGNGETVAIFDESYCRAYAQTYQEKRDFVVDGGAIIWAAFERGGCWYDAEGNMVAAPELPDGVDLYAIGNFVGDYAPVFLRGADSNVYVTLVDQTGAMLYEPVKDPSGSWSLRHYTSDENGTILYSIGGGDIRFVLKDGTLICPEEDGLSALPEDTSFPSLPYGGSGAVIREGVCYADSNGVFSTKQQYIRLNGEAVQFTLPDDVKTVKCEAIRKSN